MCIRAVVSVVFSNEQNYTPTCTVRLRDEITLDSVEVCSYLSDCVMHNGVMQLSWAAVGSEYGLTEYFNEKFAPILCVALRRLYVVIIRVRLLDFLWKRYEY